MKKRQMQGTLFVEYHVRGRRKRLSMTRRCGTLTEILQHGEKLFPSFHSRNPWIVMNSDCNKVYVGVDPERQKRSLAREKSSPAA